MQDVRAFFAHTTSDLSRSDWQPLADHLQAVAALAGERGSRIGIGALSRLAGLLHDLGKYDPLFQRRLTDPSVRVDHSTAGAWWALEGFPATPPVFRELLAHAIAGHHAGLPDRRGSGGCLDSRLEAFEPAGLDPAWKPLLGGHEAALGHRFAPAPGIAPAFRLALLGRMIFSCLVDADFRDTEAFYDAVNGVTRNRDQVLLSDRLAALIARFDETMRAIAEAKRGAARPGDLDALRGDILAAVLARAGDAPGLFTLTVPTGGGKTLASLGFALRHAAAHGLDRIIYASPYTSIIDQTADVFRSVLGDDMVLEHHSAIEEESFGPREQRDKLKLAMEDWSAPVVVTTNVQLFESLFAARPSRCRKLHNIAGSVIILDEAQSLPRPLLAPALMALETLATDWGCSIVLCTATQPALDRGAATASHPAALPIAGRELAPDPAGLAARLKRTTLRFEGPMSDDDLVTALRATDQGLVIVNSRTHALSLYQLAKDEGLAGMVHLTTRQCAADRRIILSDIRDRLKSGHPCRVAATSLVEAGVDLDFPRVLRAAAGLDQIAQAAGRCNREGRRPVEESIVTVFEAVDHPAPTEIRHLAEDARRAIDRLRASDLDLFSPEALQAYFEEVYWRLGDDLDRHRIVLGKEPLLKVAVTGSDLAFRTVAERFRMIECGLEPVIVAADDTAHAAVDRLSLSDVPSGALARQLQPYTVLVPPKARRRLIDNGHVGFAAPALRGDQFAVLKTGSLYSREVGLLWEDADYIAEEAMIL